MYMRLSVSADGIDGEPLNDVIIEEVEAIHLSMAGEARTNGDEEDGAEWRCTECHAPLDEDGDVLGELDSRRTNRHDCPERECEECFGLGTGTDDDTTCVPCKGEGYLPHIPEPVALAWCNSAGIVLDAEQDTVTVRISVGDPRGAFAMQVERMRWTDDSGEHDELRLSVPDPSMGMAHMTLTPLNGRGYFKIGR